MSIRNLGAALHPGSVAVIGADPSPGRLVLGNIVAGGFEGPVWPVGPGPAAMRGLPCFPDVAALPGVPDLGVVATPPAEVPAAVAALGARGCRVAVVVTGGLDPAARQAMLDAARPHLLRVIGPDALGVIVPEARLNASLAGTAAEPGRLALVSQSGAIASVLLDWAAEHGIGFSQVMGLGGMADVDVGDCLDLLAGDARTRAILVYLESVPAPRKLLSAARAASRLKPVVALKAGRGVEAARAAATHTGALSGADAVVDAALRRAGVLRVSGLSELLAAAETAARFRPMERARLGVVTNSGGAGVLALDRLHADGGQLAELAVETLAGLGAALASRWSGANPVDLMGDAAPDRYLAAVEAVAADAGVDAILVMHTPSALADAGAAAAVIAGCAERGLIAGKPVLACWMGGSAARAARAVLREGGVASYDTPSTAAAAVGHLTDWGKAQAALLRVPDRRAGDGADAAPGARAEVAAIFAAVARERRSLLTAPEAQAALGAYGIPSPAFRIARTSSDAGQVAAAMLAAGGRLAVKVLSREVSHKSDIGGVVLDVASAVEAERAAEGIAARLAQAVPGAVPDGFVLQPMIRRADAQELILGVGRDPVFGPVILFGAGGVAVELLGDTAVALPPLDAGLAADLVERTRVGAVLAGFLGRPPADLPALHAALVALSHLVEDFPCLRTLDVNPLLADADGVLALDARIEIDPADLERRAPNPDLAIRPYPAEWRRRIDRPEGSYDIRPIRPADALLYPAFLAHTEAEDLRLRFMAPRRQFPQELALRLTQLDYDREIAFVALTPEGELAGVSRLACDPDHRSGEYALLVRSDLQGRGIGAALMRILIDYARADGLERVEGIVLAENRGMRGLIQRLGFATELDVTEPGVVRSRLDL
jgi:acetyltransferase